MRSINEVSSLLKMQKVPITKACKVKHYLKIEDKNKFCEEYAEIINKHLEDYKGLGGYIPLVFLDLLIVKYYTDISVEMTYECYDTLMGAGIIGEITKEIKDEYSLMMKLVLANMTASKE